ncbi:CDP-alcohol phosphatidyltransferase family protein [Loigolactobacillus jiayinensis]|uniref:CDP-alcohol phosphatidyltransferase family protein n=1 Tax=Loigolactobacillus jiayinensis TaxID=2486016 RepID=A0ABW1RA96_9LACO|nr:CDP-alcohol phosphatidyltransferase family protein [Loigolactobacillus jiayinensis]
MRTKDHYSLADIINSRSSEKKYIDKIDIWVFTVVRPLSNLLTWLFLKLRLSANQATFISTIVGFLGAIIVIFAETPMSTVIGLIILNFWIVFDCIDGNIARTTHTSSKLGMYLDGISGYCYVSLLYTALGVNVYKNYKLIIFNNNYSWLYILIGALASMACVFPRLVEHKAGTSFLNFNSGLTDKMNYNWFYILGLNLAGMAGLSNPLMIIFFMLHRLNIYLILYFIIQLAIEILSIFKTIRRVYKISYEVD